VGELIESRDYSTAQIAEGLAVLAQHAGNARKASEQTGIPRTTLKFWKTKYPQRYEEAAQKITRDVERAIARQARENAVRAADVERLGLQRARERLERDEDKQPATTAQRAAVVKGISIDKMLTLEGRPTVHVAHSVEEDLRFLRARAIPDAEVVEENANVAGLLPSSDGAAYEGK
jgi:hypothetical protein